MAWKPLPVGGSINPKYIYLELTNLMKLSFINLLKRTNTGLINYKILYYLFL